MIKNKRFHTSKFKAKVALDLIKGEVMSSICSRYEIHPTQAGRWREQALKGLEGVFSDKRSNETEKQKETINELYRQVGQMKVETDWLKKKLPFD